MTGNFYMIMIKRCSMRLFICHTLYAEWICILPCLKWFEQLNQSQLYKYTTNHKISFIRVRNDIAFILPFLCAIFFAVANDFFFTAFFCFKFTASVWWNLFKCVLAGL